MHQLLPPGLILAVLLAYPSLVHGQKAKDGPIDSSDLTPGTYSGILKTLPGSDRVFVVEVATQVFTPNASAIRNRAKNAAKITQLRNQILQAQAQMARSRTPQQRSQAVRRVQQLQRQLTQTAASMARAKLGSYKTVKRMVEFQATKDLKVRSSTPLEVFDEKGNIKKFTQAELLELKGKDRHLPGYESSLEFLETGQQVSVTLKSVPTKVRAKDDIDVDDFLEEAEKRRQVTVIVVGS